MQFESRTHLPKWPFLAGDLVLVVLALVLILQREGSLDPMIAAIATLLGVAGCCLGVAPFLFEHQSAARRELDEERAQVRDLAARLSAMGRDLDVAAQSVRDAAADAVRAAKVGEALPSRMQAAVNDLERRVANVNTENSERFAMVGEQLQAAVQQFAGSESALAGAVRSSEALMQEVSALNLALARAEFERRHASSEPVAAPVMPAAFEEVVRGQADLMGKLDEILEKLRALPAATPPSPLETAYEQIAPVPGTEPLPAANPVRKRRLPLSGLLTATLLDPQTPAVERIIAAGRSQTPAAGSGTPTSAPEALTETPAPVEDTLPVPGEPPVSIVTEERGTDELGLDLGELPAKPASPKFAPAPGAAVLVVRAFIGIGNRLHVRGHGPGLDPERGVPMVFLEIGKWAWACPEPGVPVRVSLYKNDEQPAAEGVMEIQAGQTLEVSPQF